MTNNHELFFCTCTDEFIRLFQKPVPIRQSVNNFANARFFHVPLPLEREGLGMGLKP